MDLGELDPGTYTINDSTGGAAPIEVAVELIAHPSGARRLPGLCDDRPVNPLDLVAILLVIVAVMLGARSGAIPQVGGLLGAIAGGALVGLAAADPAEPLSGVDPTIRPWLVLGGLIGAVGLGESIGAAAGRWAAARARAPAS